VDLGGGFYSGANGQYSIMVCLGQSLTLTPVLEGFDFEPVTVTFSNINENIIHNFVAEPWCPDQCSGGGLPDGNEVPVDYPELSWNPPDSGIMPTHYLVTLSDHANYMNPILHNAETTEPFFLLDYITFDYDTDYFVKVVPNYTPEGFNFGCDGPALEWSFHTEPWTVSGYAGINAVVDLGYGYYTDSEGNFSIAIELGQNLTLTPELEGYYFEPATVTFTNIQDNLVQDFLAIPLVDVDDPLLPQVTELSGNYPNPFNPFTCISFSVRSGEEATLTIFNMKGQIIERKEFGPGLHKYEWNALGRSSGMYFYTLNTPTYNNTKKMILLK
ncbi:MAG: T9SS type A sorting domain-containing protein, partial [Candidatus Cloacimonetes bacterium]|nr:T9SS type A sorting domain-containing protein [Candidatus Cloacimonadota bacterium]